MGERPAIGNPNESTKSTEPRAPLPSANPQPWMKLYLAGPMSGLPDHNFPAFFQAAADLRKAGYFVLNPAERCPREEMHALGYEGNLKADLLLLLQCDGIALMLGWELSRGATFEHSVSRTLGYAEGTVTGWLERAQK